MDNTIYFPLIVLWSPCVKSSSEVWKVSSPKIENTYRYSPIYTWKPSSDMRGVYFLFNNVELHCVTNKIDFAKSCLSAL